MAELDLTKLSNEELLAMAGEASPAASAPAGGQDLTKLSNEELLALDREEPQGDAALGAIGGAIVPGIGGPLLKAGFSALPEGAQESVRGLVSGVSEKFRGGQEDPESFKTGEALGEAGSPTEGFIAKSITDLPFGLGEPILTRYTALAESLRKGTDFDDELKKAKGLFSGLRKGFEKGSPIASRGAGVVAFIANPAKKFLPGGVVTKEFTDSTIRSLAQGKPLEEAVSDGLFSGGIAKGFQFVPGATKLAAGKAKSLTSSAFKLAKKFGSKQKAASVIAQKIRDGASKTLLKGINIGTAGTRKILGKLNRDPQKASNELIDYYMVNKMSGNDPMGSWDTASALVKDSGKQLGQFTDDLSDTLVKQNKFIDFKKEIAGRINKEVVRPLEKSLDPDKHAVIATINDWVNNFKQQSVGPGGKSTLKSVNAFRQELGKGLDKAWNRLRDPSAQATPQDLGLIRLWKHVNSFADDAIEANAKILGPDANAVFKELRRGVVKANIAQGHFAKLVPKDFLQADVLGRDYMASIALENIAKGSISSTLLTGLGFTIRKLSRGAERIALPAALKGAKKLEEFAAAPRPGFLTPKDTPFSSRLGGAVTRELFE